MAVVEFKNVDVIFGKPKASKRACQLLDEGKSREEILRETNAVLGVSGASLTVEEGEICVLMGLSGSGKSSLLRCVNGLNTVTRGELLIEHNGGVVDMAAVSEKQLRELRKNRIAMVFQQFGLLPWSTVRDNVGFGLEIKGLAKPQIDEIVNEKLELVHLTEWAEKYVHELSGGMQQRVGLARAFATDADILLMDEPFSALDPLIREHLQDELLELQQRLKRTIIFVSHDLNEALKLGNQIAIMDGGAIIQSGRAEDIIFNPANDYVRRFVANINPLDVLYGSVLMRPLEQCEFNNGCLSIDGGCQVYCDENGVPVRVVDEGTECALSWFENYQGSRDCALMIDWETWMRDIVAAARRSRFPLLVTKEKQLIGIITEHQIYSGLLRQEAP